MHIFFELVILLLGTYPDEMRNAYKDMHGKSLQQYFNSEKLELHCIFNKRKLVKLYSYICFKTRLQ